MIRYALACPDAHEFESWFPSSEAFDAQSRRGLVTCPVCESGRIEKRIMAPAIARTDRSSPVATPIPAPPPAAAVPEAAQPPQPVALLTEREQAVRAMLRAVREHVTRTADYVGASFADEARKMHHGEIEHRSIYGEANPADARALAEEGITVHPLPVLPEDRN